MFEQERRSPKQQRAVQRGSCRSCALRIGALAIFPSGKTIRAATGDASTPSSLRTLICIAAQARIDRRDAANQPDGQIHLKRVKFFISVFRKYTIGFRASAALCFAHPVP
jgi:hypothetical protein